MQTDCTILDSFNPISLDEMSSIRLMNRIDSKYLANEEQLKQLLLMAQGEYMVQAINGVRQSEYSTQYLDDRYNTMYLNHHNGRLTRQKVRIRTYVDTGDYFFEIKLKNNHGRTKKKRIHLTGADTYVQDGAAQFLEEHAMLSIINAMRTNSDLPLMQELDPEARLDGFEAEFERALSAAGKREKSVYDYLGLRRNQVRAAQQDEAKAETQKDGE